MRNLTCLIFIFGVQLILVNCIVEQASISLNVLDFGAKGNGKHNDTGAIQAALDKCDSFESCAVLLPTGYTFYSFPLTIRTNNTALIIDGDITLPSFDDAKDHWEKINEEYVPFLTTEPKGSSRLRNLTITGNGTIDGQGDDWWEKYEKKVISGRPMLLVINSVDEVELSYLTLLHSPSFHVMFISCHTVLAYRVSVMSPRDSPNTDGIDTAYCTDVVIKECSISNGDDCVAIKDDCSNVLVEDCFFQYGHGASIGSIDKGLTSNVTFRNLYTDSLLYTLRIKVWNGTDGRVENVTFENVVMTNSTVGIYIDMFYGDHLHNLSQIPHYDSPQSNLVSNVRFNNIVGHEVDSPGAFICSYCDKIYLNDVHIATRTGKEQSSEKKEPYFQCFNAYGEATKTSPNVCLEKPQAV